MTALFAEYVDTPGPNPAGEPQRRAALLLHSMPTADRTWTLDQLSQEQRDLLLPLLSELEHLGVPVDCPPLHEALGERPPERVLAASVTSSSPSAEQKLATASAKDVVELLAQEPAQLVRRVLSIRPWPWADGVIAGLHARRGDFLEPATQPTPSDVAAVALDDALVRHLAARLCKTDPEDEAGRSAWMKRLPALFGPRRT